MFVAPAESFQIGTICLLTGYTCYVARTVALRYITFIALHFIFQVLWRHRFYGRFFRHVAIEAVEYFYYSGG